jgi:transcriptional regulator with XRE-family HTH domain
VSRRREHARREEHAAPLPICPTADLATIYREEIREKRSQIYHRPGNIEVNVQDSFRRSDRVEVKMKGGAGDFVWKPGRVEELAGRGAFVLLDEGNRNFFYLRDLRPESEAKPRPAQAFAKLGDAVQPKPAPQQAPRNFAPAPKPSGSNGITHPAKTLVAPAAPVPAPPPQPAPPPPAVVAPAIPVEQPAAQLRHLIRQKKSLTAIGAVLFRVRQSEMLTQRQLAKVMGCTDWQMAGFEQGTELPGDDFLMALAERLDVDLDELVEAVTRDRNQQGPEEGGAAPSVPPVVVVPAPAKVEPTAPPAPPATPPRASAPRRSLEAFTAELSDVAPLPPDRGRRVRWFEIARELWELDG